MDPTDPGSTELIMEVEGGGWGIMDWSPDDKKMLIAEYKSINESNVYLFDIESGNKTLVSPTSKKEAVSNPGGRFSKDGKYIWTVTDKGSEFRKLARMDVDGKNLKIITENINWDINGFDINEDSLKHAIENNIIDESFVSIEEINNKNLASYIDLIVIAVSPEATKNIVNGIESLWNSDVTITDTASVKAHLLFKDTSNLVLSHPIAGSDKSGVLGADENLFTGKKTVICNPFNAERSHTQRLEDFWKFVMQMRVSEMSVKDHDLMFAMTSHLPHLISYALIDSIRLSSKDVKDNVGGGLKEFIRLSGSNPEMWRDIFELNDKNIIKSLASFQLSINNLLELITKTKELPEIFSHSDLLKKELEDIKKYKEDTF